MEVSPVLEDVRTAGTVCVRDSMVLYTVEIKHLREYKKIQILILNHMMALLYKVNHWASSKISVAQNQKLSA